MQIKIKPQWLFEPSVPCLRSELLYHAINPNEVEFVTKLVAGIDSTAVTLDEFDLLEKFNTLQLLTFVDHPQLGLSELHGVELKRVLELQENVTLNVIDQTGQHQTYFEEKLIELGFKLTSEPTLTVMIADSFMKLPNPNGPTLPIILNRFRPSVGPLLTPWRLNVGPILGPQYMPVSPIDVPSVFIDMQRAWAVISIYQFIIKMKTDKVSNIAEFNTVTMRQHWWPVNLVSPE